MEYEKIYAYIKGLLSARMGNYMVFFPSYKMLEEVARITELKGLPEGFRLYCQNPGMQEKEREQFLLQFEQEGTVGFCIMGGIFSEGIDLTGERLIGAVIVGTGIPMVCREREILRQYFENREGMGFAYAYQYPGMNKVMQAAGRVIRTTTDKGVILLLDERFLYASNQQLFPEEWRNLQVITAEQAEAVSKEFWN